MNYGPRERRLPAGWYLRTPGLVNACIALSFIYISVCFQKFNCSLMFSKGTLKDLSVYHIGWQKKTLYV